MYKFRRNKFCFNITLQIKKNVSNKDFILLYMQIRLKYNVKCTRSFVLNF